MRKTVLVGVLAALCVYGFAPAEAKAPSLQKQVSSALKIARQAQKTANAALKASKRVPAVIKGTPGTPGAKGDTGPQGAPGATGRSGVDGQNGAAGMNGVNGARGADGATGATGPVGPQGPKGDPGTGGVKAFGHVSTGATGTELQGTTVTHPGNGLYCVTDDDYTAVVVTPDASNATAFALTPTSPYGSCGAGRWTVVVSNNSGTDTGFYLMAN